MGLGLPILRLSNGQGIEVREARPFTFYDHLVVPARCANGMRLEAFRKQFKSLGQEWRPLICNAASECRLIDLHDELFQAGSLELSFPVSARGRLRDDREARLVAERLLIRCRREGADWCELGVDQMEERTLLVFSWALGDGRFVKPNEVVFLDAIVYTPDDALQLATERDVHIQLALRGTYMRTGR